MNVSHRTEITQTASPAVTLDAVVAATGRDGTADVREYLAELSHLDPDDNPLEHARIWQQIHELDHAEAAGNGA